MCNPDHGTVLTREKGKTQFYDFVQKTYEGLYMVESRALGARSSISIFCRIDISLIVEGDIVHYFVNEVKRYHTCSLWSNRKTGPNSSKVSIGTFADTFSETFHKSLVDIFNPYSF
jgi:hypothetical protein